MTDHTLIEQKAKKIKWLIMDVDGIFNDGLIYFGAEGEHIKAFHVHDGLGLTMLKKQGFHMAIISGRQSQIVKNRFNDLGVSECHLGHLDKISVYDMIKKTHKLSDEMIAYIGDDLPDLPCVAQAGLGITVPNAVNAVKQAADWITDKPGGQGAIREVCDLFIKVS
jgi:3-deoxy-D-manno-octulosonate 8-phosphate phosphatase (KDO 8-P phosphatase)